MAIGDMAVRAANTAFETGTAGMNSGGLSGADWLTLIQAGGEGLKSGLDALGRAGASRKSKKEAKRQTLADMYNKALARELEALKFESSQGGDLAFQRGKALKRTANEFTKSLV